MALADSFLMLGYVCLSGFENGIRRRIATQRCSCEPVFDSNIMAGAMPLVTPLTHEREHDHNSLIPLFV
jgi:hypothetical protein